MLARKTYPDFGSISQAVPTPGIDITEIAARLGAPDTLRRSGKVFWYDDFIDLHAWQVNHNAYIAARGAFGPGCLKLAPVGPADPTASVTARYPLIIGHSVGLEYNFCMDDTAGDLSVYFSQLTAAALVMGGIEVETQTHNLTYITTGGAQTTLLTMPPFLSNAWHNVKMVMDLVNNRYKYIAVDENEFYNDYPLWVSAGGVNRNFTIGLESGLYGFPAYLPTYVDYLIFTIDEL